MIKNFLFVLKRFKTFSLLNILGLSAAIFIFLIVPVQVHDDLTFNSSIPNHENIFQVVKKESTAVDEKYNCNFTLDERDLFVSKIPEIKKYCFVRSGGYSKELIFKIHPDREKEEKLVSSTFVGKGFEELFNPCIVEGSMEDVFSGPGNTMISLSTAQDMFGNESPIGQIVELSTWDSVSKTGKNEEATEVSVFSIYKPFTIKAVYKDYADNSSINNGFITYEEEQDFLFYTELYVEIDHTMYASVQDKLNLKEIVEKIDFYSLKANQERILNQEIENRLELLPIRNIQINYSTVSQKGQPKNTVYFLLSIGVFALIIGYINFLNFTIAMAPIRVHSIHIRMIWGSDKRRLQMILASEAILFTFCAIVFALIAISFIQDTSVVQLFKVNLSVVSQWKVLLSVCLVLLLLSLLVGVYPARYIVNFNSMLTLNSSNTTGIRSSRLRNVLMVVQFFVALSFIIIALLIKQQHHYLVNYSVGFDKEDVLLLTTKGREPLLDADLNTFVQEVMRNPAVSEYSASSGVIGKDGLWSRFSSRIGESIYVWNGLSVSDHFLDFFKIPLLEREGVQENRGEKIAPVIINEEFLKLNHIKGGLQEIKEESLFQSDNVGELVGIVKNFSYSPLLNKMGALMITHNDLNEMSHLYFKAAEGKMPEARVHIENIWKKFSDDDIRLEFLDENLEQLYQSQHTLAIAISTVSLIIILIAIMGTYGLITFQTKYRTKEIAIRKVNGAGVGEVICLLNRGLLLQFLIACLLAIPISYYVVDLWLRHFRIRFIFPGGLWFRDVSLLC